MAIKIRPAARLTPVALQMLYDERTDDNGENAGDRAVLMRNHLEMRESVASDVATGFRGTLPGSTNRSGHFVYAV